jgi:hypothetical protein
MFLRGPFIALALTGLALSAGKPLPVEDPPPCVVKNAASGLFADAWSIRVSEKTAPVGIIKIYDMDNNMLAAMQGPGDCFNLKPGQAVKVAVCPEARQENNVVAVTLDFAKASNRDDLPPPSASVSFSQTTQIAAKPTPVPFEIQPIKGKVRVDKDAYLSPVAEAPFVTLGKN